MSRPPMIPRRSLAAFQRPGDSLRTAERRWQSAADPAIYAHVVAGKSRAWCAEQAGVSKTAILAALRRYERFLPCPKCGHATMKLPKQKGRNRHAVRFCLRMECDWIETLSSEGV